MECLAWDWSHVLRVLPRNTETFRGPVEETDRGRRDDGESVWTGLKVYGLTVSKIKTGKKIYSQSGRNKVEKL